MKTDNEFIALFMGNKPITNNGYLVGFHIVFGYRNGETSIDNLQYHTSWDWLMPVVEKIGTMNAEVKMCTGVDRCLISYDDRKEIGGEWMGRIYVHQEHLKLIQKNNRLIDCVYEATVQFIKWHNESNRKP
jgi:hypothetical protein